MKYQTKKCIIEATQWFKNGDHPKDDCLRPFEDTGAIPNTPREGKVVRYWRRPDIEGKTLCTHCCKTMDTHGWIDTLEGGHIVCPGDFIITGLKGENYPCKSDIFEMKYEPVKEDILAPI